MKHIITLFVFSAMVGSAFITPNKPEFHEFFKVAYDQSFSGLDQMKDDKTGNWNFIDGVEDFNKCEIEYDFDKAVHFLKFQMDVEDNATGVEIMARYEDQLTQILPNTDYKIIPVKREGCSKNAVQFEFQTMDIAEKAKYPTIELDVIENGTSSQMVIRLYEAFTKTTGNQKK